MSSLPYSNATSGQRALDEIQRILKKFGCSKFAYGTDWETGEIFIQFEHRSRPISLKASSRGYAAAWLRENPWTHRRHSTKAEWEAKALETGGIAIYSILRDWIKGQVAAIESGILSFESVFLSYILLPSGKNVLEEVTNKNMLPPPKEDSNE